MATLRAIPVPNELPQVPSKLVGKRLGRYEVLHHLATGGMATVLVARAQGIAGFERLVALKVLHPHLAFEPEFIGMFLDEARLAARIRHPNVVATQDINNSDEDGLYLVMDYVEGDHLARLLSRSHKRGARIPEPVVARIVLDALAGLSAAHRLTDEHGEPLQLVHRDISPENILVGIDGVARITDFGVARAESRIASTRAGQLKGKISYMSPEQATTGECDQRSDLFAMGVVLWESLLSRRLFRGDSTATTLSRVLNDPIPVPSSIDPTLAPWDRVIEGALARSPDDRFRDADEFIEAVEDAARARADIASARVVAATLREFVGDKLEDDHARIAHAIEASDSASEATLVRGARDLQAIASGVVPSRPTDPAMPLAGGTSRPSIEITGTSADIRALREAASSGEFSAPIYVVREGSNRTTVLLVVSLLLVAVLASVAGYYANHASRPASTTYVAVPAPASRTASSIPPPATSQNASSASASPPTGEPGRASTPNVPTPAPRARRPRPARIPVEDNPYRVQ